MSIRTFLYRHRPYVVLVLLLIHSFLFFSNGPLFFPSEFVDYIHHSDKSSSVMFSSAQEDIALVQKMEETLAANPQFHPYLMMLSFFILALLSLALLIGFFWLVLKTISFFRKDWDWPACWIRPYRAFRKISLTWGDLIRLSLIYVGLSQVVQYFTYLVGLIFDQTFLTSPFVTTLLVGVSALVLNLGFCCFIGWFLFLKYGQSVGYLGIRLGRFCRHAFYALLSYVMFFPLVFLSVIFMAWLLEMKQIEPVPHPLVPIMLKEGMGFNIWILILFSCVIGPITEEFIFRGVIYGTLRRYIKPLGAMVVSAFLFALMHGNLVLFAGIFILGFLFASLYERTGSLVASSVIHVIHNSVMMFFVLFVKQFL